MTPEQLKDVERFERYIMREGLASRMNDTKWREAIQVLQDVMDRGLQFRLKDLRGSEPSADYWDRSFPNHVPPYKAIEWFEANPIVKLHDGQSYTGESVDYTEALTQAFREKGIPFEMSAGVLRIQAYTRP